MAAQEYPVCPAQEKWGTKAEIVVVGETATFWKVKVQNADCASEVDSEAADSIYDKEYKVKKREDGKYKLHTCFGFAPDVWSFEYKP